MGHIFLLLCVPDIFYSMLESELLRCWLMDISYSFKWCFVLSLYTVKFLGVSLIISGFSDWVHSSIYSRVKLTSWLRQYPCENSTPYLIYYYIFPPCWWKHKFSCLTSWAPEFILTTSFRWLFLRSLRVSFHTFTDQYQSDCPGDPSMSLWSSLPQTQGFFFFPFQRSQSYSSSFPGLKMVILPTVKTYTTFNGLAQ